MRYDEAFSYEATSYLDANLEASEKADGNPPPDVGTEKYWIITEPLTQLI
jgi:hypothetical protein